MRQMLGFAAIVVAVAAVVILFSVGGDMLEGGVAEKPDWWALPDAERTAGVEWPPPEPENWVGDWPPDESVDDPEFWVRRFRAMDVGTLGDEHDPENPGGEGFAGHQGFTRGFPATDDSDWHAIMQERTPELDCPFFRVVRLEREAVESCTPFPAENVKASCTEARTEEAARAECASACEATVDVVEGCAESRMHSPEMFTAWGCGPSDEGGDAGAQAYCRTNWLCECGAG